MSNPPPWMRPAGQRVGNRQLFGGAYPGQYALQHRNRTPAVSPPTQAQLEHEARTLSKTAAQENNLCRAAQNWRCPNADCDQVAAHIPTNSLLTMLRPLRCVRCKRLNPTVEDWSILQCVVNNIELQIPVYNQGPFSTCVAFAICAAMYLRHRILGALQRHYFTVPLDVGNLLFSYNQEFGQGVGNESHDVLETNRIENLLRCAMTTGVAFQEPPLPPRGVPGYYRRLPPLRVQHIFSLDAGDQDQIIRVIAAGYPLIAGVTVGRCFRFLPDGGVYYGPAVLGNHAVLLVGFGVRMRPGVVGHNVPARLSAPEPAVYYKARDSGGDLAHANHETDGFGGDFNIWADDVTEQVWGFDLAR